MQDAPRSESGSDLAAGLSFPSTRWSLVLADPAAGSAGSRGAFEALARRYWRPTLAYVRARWAQNDEDARDATQEFFLWMLEGNFLAHADPSRGRFRGLVKKSLANFLHDLERKRRTLKRGGARRFQPLQDEQGEPWEPPDPAGRSPEDVLDDEWRRTLLAQAAEGLEAELSGAGKRVVFEVFRDYFLEEEDLDYAAVARRHGITTVDVSNHLTQAKRRYRAHLRAAVLETVQGDADLRAELSWLFEEKGP